MKNRLLLLSMLVLPACTESLVMDSKEDMPVVVKCILTRDGGDYERHPETETDFMPPMQYLDLYYAKKASQKEYSVISDASVCIKTHERTYYFSWNGSRWECALLPEFNKKYTMEIITSDGKELTSTMVFPPDCRLIHYPLIADRINVVLTPMTLSTCASYCFIANHYDSNKGCQYRVFNGECSLWIRAFDNGNPIKRLCTSHPNVDNFNIINGVFSGCAIYDDYNNQFFEIMERKGFFPGLLGEIEVDSSLWEKYSTLTKSCAMHDSFLRIQHPRNYNNSLKGDWKEYVANDFPNQITEPKDLFSIDADFDDTPKTVIIEGQEFPAGLLSGCEYEVRFLSSGYDKYLKSIIEKNYIHGDEFSKIYSAEPVYSNIEGGLGCFGGQWITTTVAVDQVFPLL